MATGTLSQYETGKRRPGFEAICSIASKFSDINLDWLIMGTGPMLKRPTLHSEAPSEYTEIEAQVLPRPELPPSEPGHELPEKVSISHLKTGEIKIRAQEIEEIFNDRVETLLVKENELRELINRKTEQLEAKEQELIAFEARLLEREREHEKALDEREKFLERIIDKLARELERGRS